MPSSSFLPPKLSKFHSNPRKHPWKQLPCILQPFFDISSKTQLTKAVSSLELLTRKGILLPTRALTYLIRQCASFKSLRLGKWVHLHLKITGRRRPNTFLENNLIFMYLECGDHDAAYKVFDKMSVRNVYSWNNMLSGYAKLGMVRPARRLFDRMPEKDVVSWNTMVMAYTQSGVYGEAVRLFRELRRLEIGYNQYTFAGLLTVCAKSKDLWLTRQVHGQVLVVGFLSNMVIASSLMDAYAKCGEMGNAQRVFDLMNVKDVHAWTTIVSGYARWGDMEAACELFHLMPYKNPVSWTALIAGYVRNGFGHKALKLFAEMMVHRIPADQYTFSSCLCACASLALVKHGKQIHGYLVRINFRPNTIVVSSLVDMYSKCGCLVIARQVFDLAGDKQQVVLWNTMISALAQHGRGGEAIQLFDEMVGTQVKPDRITLVVTLSACSHSGLVQEGLRLFDSMNGDHGIIPDQEHYACLIDLLGRAGQFDKLISQLEKMACEPNEQIWNAFLGVCQIQGNLELGREVAQQLIELDPQSSAAYVLLSSAYAADGRWELVEKVRQLMKKRHAKKERAISSIEIDNKVHSSTDLGSIHP
ncbi:Pentatricopeptide repeat-containing protein [Turnera subulata]|uniref:Pentatricopeptide repeat-containing protein n=1 Tax=Turnera subulata TaxID=218843 RepID=A0A9Q0JMS4_9ROSI|nr:Pentatricopeptide repeat-containing protein [Turnera subulata]